MDILAFNAESKLANIARSIAKDHYSWKQWKCLHIDISDISTDIKEECLVWVKSITDSYLDSVEGRVYFCHDEDIHIFCKNISADILKQAGFQICDLIYSENKTQSDYKLYDLCDDPYGYACFVLQKQGLVDSVSVRLPSGSALLDYLPQKTKAPAMAHKNRSGDDVPPRVLLIEDDAVTRWIVRNTLMDECEFATAPSASKAYHMFNSFHPDVIFLDINLPDQNGYEILEWIMRTDPSACVVMFSGNDNLDNITSALEDGAAGFIAKPFIKDNLLHYVRGYHSIF